MRLLLFIAFVSTLAYAQEAADSTQLDTLTVEQPQPAAPDTARYGYPEGKDLSRLERDLIDDLQNSKGKMLSPYHSLANFLLCLQKHYYYPKLAARSMNIRGMEEEDVETALVKLKKILDGRGIYVYLEELPRDPNYTDSTKNRHRFLLSADYPDIYLERIDGEWVFPKYTLQQIPKLYAELYPMGVDKLFGMIPDSFKESGQILWMDAYSWTAVLILLIIAIIVHKLLTFLLSFVVGQILSRLRIGKFANNLLNPVSRPLSIVLILYFIRYFVPALEMPPATTQFVLFAFGIFIPVFGTVIAYRLVGVVGNRLGKYTEKTESSLDDQLLPMVQKVARVIVILAGFILVLSNLDFDLTALIAGLSIGGLALALAAQDTVKNFFGSILIFMDKPFQVGDWVKVDSMEGTVEEVGFRATRIRTFYNSLVYVPNGVLADRMVDNMGLREYRRMFINLGVQYDTPPHLIEAFVGGLKEIVNQHPYTRKDAHEIHLNNFGASSIDVMFYIFFKCDTWTKELEARQEVMLSVMKLAHGLGVRFAYPTQTLHVENLPGQPNLGADYTLDAEGADKTMQELIAKEKGNWKE